LPYASRSRSLTGDRISVPHRRAWADTDGLLIRPCNSIHTFFMRMPIDVVFATREGVVLDVSPARPPWRVGPIVWRAAWVLELPAGAIAASGTRLDDHLAVECVAHDADG
jgi:uncharacterized membrane protein (UPF0127 family)